MELEKQDISSPPTMENKQGQELSEDEQIIFLPFLAGTEWYAVEVKYIKELIKPVPITLIPETPEFLVGVINLRGEIIPVFDLLVFFNSGSSKDTYKRILIANHEHDLLGFLIDINKEVTRIPPNVLQPPLMSIDGSKRESLKGIFYHQGKMITLLDLPGIILSPRINSANW